MAGLIVDSRGQGNKPFDAFHQAIRTAIPVFLQKKRIESRKEQQDQEFDRLMQESHDRQIKELLELDAEKTKASDKITTELTVNAYESGDQGVRDTIGPMLEELGIQPPKTELAGPTRPGENLTQYLGQEQEPGKFNEKTMLWKESGQNLERYKELRDQLGEDDGKFNENEMLWEASDHNLEKYIGLKNSMKAKGTSLEVGPDGEISFTQGGPQGAQQPTKTMQTKIQQKAVASSEGLSRVSEIVKGFDPSFLEIPTRLGVSWSKIKDMMGVKLSSDQEQQLEKFSVFRQNALENINLYIKEITGAQMSEKEADRLRKVMPDPGEGWFDGDSPRTFQAKTINTYQKLRAASIRYNYYLKQGVGEETVKQWVNNGTVMSIPQLKKVIDSRGKQLEKTILAKNPKMSTQNIFTQVKARLAEEFGTGF